MSVQDSAAGGSQAETIVKTLDSLGSGLATLNSRLENLEKSAVYPHGSPGGAAAVHTGESANTSRPYSLARLAKALMAKQDDQPGWRDHAKVELGLSEELRKAYHDAGMALSGGGIAIPLGHEFMPSGSVETDQGTVGGISTELIHKCRDLMTADRRAYDPEQLDWISKRMGPAGLSALRKDLSANAATSGGSLVAMSAQGELIEYLRAKEVMSRAGAIQISLPPQGKIRFPRVTSTVTIASTSEGATISESTPATGALELSAKTYTGLTDVPEELLRFATTVSVEAWLRDEFTRQLALVPDADMISGAGGQKIQGMVTFSGAQSVTATTVATNGNTLGPQDPMRLYAAIADQNAPVDKGFFYALTNTLWAGLTTKRSDSVTAADGAGIFLFNAMRQVIGDRVVDMLNGNLVIPSTQVPTDRVKGSGTTLTMLVGGVGAEWVIARAGVVEVVMTNSDASKFQQRISTLRGTTYLDAGPRHEQSFGMVDSLLNQ